ncbi:hypothetical protein N7G274_001702 [Stereocaulon virgatum]|uniref:DUF1749-domain-containing protein n=1 Tax=Stereocaulon virgatum TaxID=373712 RepID=A0ABR4ALA4_9LECA
MTTPDIHPGVLHRIPRLSTTGFPAPPLTAFEHSHGFSDPSTNTLIFLGGLFDGLLTVPFVPTLVRATSSNWTLTEPVLSSAYRQWGFSSLGEDVAEITILVEYFRKLRPKGRIVLLGHSTGSQQVMHYLLTKPTLPKIDGAIFQASASDREVMTMFLQPSVYDSGCALAQSYVNEGREDDILPFGVTKSLFMSAPVSAKRFLSLASPGPLHAGEDDYFSSDLEDGRLENTFGVIGKTKTRLCFLFSGSDEYVPDTVDRVKMVQRWHEHARRGGGVIDESSGVVSGATHTLKEGGMGLEDLVKRVVKFLGKLDVASEV